jgi:phosphoheptose isomerase
VVSALRWANAHELTTIGITGFDGGKAAALCEISIHVASENYGVVEDVHQSVMHALAQYIRQSHMSDEAVTKHTF